MRHQPLQQPSTRTQGLLAIAGRASARAGYKLTVDLETRTLSDEYGLKLEFEVDDFRRHCLMNGLDDIALTLEQVDKITAYEEARGIA